MIISQKLMNNLHIFLVIVLKTIFSLVFSLKGIYLTVRRKNEDAKWSGYERNKQLTTPIHAGHLKGLKDLTQGRGIELKPYISMNNKAMPSQEIILAITRQESEFDPKANSYAGAKGMMQLMTYTAKLVAKQMKEPYSKSK